MSQNTKWYFSIDNEGYHGPYHSEAGAIEAALVDLGNEEIVNGSFLIGTEREPFPPENYFEENYPASWQEWLWDQGDYSQDSDCNFLDATDAQYTELTSELKAVAARWLERHGLRPDHKCIDEVREYDTKDGKAILSVPAATQADTEVNQ